MPGDDIQFNTLTENLEIPEEGLSFLDFVAIREGEDILTTIQHEAKLSWESQDASVCEEKLLVKLGRDQ